MSQYLADYLDAAERKRWTPATFLNRALTGKAKRYQSRYHGALMRALEREMSAGRVVAVPSAKGGTAYIERIE